MISLFYPAIRLSNAVTFKTKFSLLTLLFALPLLYFFSILSIQARQQIIEAEIELQASQYIIPLRNLVEHVAQTRGMTNALLNGDESFRTSVMSKRKVVGEDFESLISIDLSMQDLFATDGLPSEFLNNWQEINKRTVNSSNPSKIFSDYTQLIRSILDFMDTIGREGHMLQDSDPANSYMINSLLHTLPEQVEALGKLRGKGSGVIASQAFTVQNKVSVSALADKRNASILGKDMAYLFSSAPELKLALESDYNQAIDKLNNYLSLANEKIVEADKATIKPEMFFSEGTETISSLFVLFDKLQPKLEQRLLLRKAKESKRFSGYVISILFVLLLLSYVYIGIYFGIKLNLSAMEKVAQAICDGNLNVRMELKTNDELRQIGIAINDIGQALNQSIVSVKESSESIEASADQIASISESSATGMVKQSEELEQISTAVTEMSASVNEVAQYAEQGSEAAQQADGKAKGGPDVVNKTVSAIEILATNINVAVSGIRELEENSNNISGILDVIRGVAEQTNLLALNAAIEAARAGEQGRGFAVVADEVRTLAQRTQQSTLEIQGVIEIIQNGISGVAEKMDESQQHATTAVEHSKEAGSALESISNSISNFVDMSLQIATASEEQSAVSEEIAQSVVRVTAVANDTAEGSTVLLNSGAQLKEMSQKMGLLVGRYVLDSD